MLDHRDKRLSFDSAQDDCHTEQSKSVVNIEIPIHELTKFINIYEHNQAIIWDIIRCVKSQINLRKQSTNAVFPENFTSN